MVGGTFEAWNAGSDDGPAFSFALGQGTRVQAAKSYLGPQAVWTDLFKWVDQRFLAGLRLIKERSPNRARGASPRKR